MRSSLKNQLKLVHFSNLLPEVHFSNLLLGLSSSVERKSKLSLLRRSQPLPVVYFSHRQNPLLKVCLPKMKSLKRKKLHMLSRQHLDQNPQRPPLLSPNNRAYSELQNLPKDHSLETLSQQPICLVKLHLHQEGYSAQPQCHQVDYSVKLLKQTLQHRLFSATLVSQLKRPCSVSQNL